jgi:hypothetical protein
MRAFPSFLTEKIKKLFQAQQGFKKRGFVIAVHADSKFLEQQPRITILLLGVIFVPQTINTT